MCLRLYPGIGSGGEGRGRDTRERQLIPGWIQIRYLREQRCGKSRWNGRTKEWFFVFPPHSEELEHWAGECLWHQKKRERAVGVCLETGLPSQPAKGQKDHSRKCFPPTSPPAESFLSFAIERRGGKPRKMPHQNEAFSWLSEISMQVGSFVSSWSVHPLH